MNAVVLISLLGIVFVVSEPVRVDKKTILKLRQGRFRSAEDRTYSARDLDRWTHASAFRRALESEGQRRPPVKKVAK